MHNYVRSALKLGLELEGRLGANPYQAGMIGGNDAHVGVVTTREDNFFGEFANGLPSPERWKTPLAMGDNDTAKPVVSVWNESAAGLGGVWARENTREAIWDALKRREVYATTGDRPVVRVFAGWHFVPTDLDRPDFAANGYAHGVPMGGNLTKASAGERPAFLVYALRDPDGPNIDRIQIIKGWIGKDGKSSGAHFRRGAIGRAQDRPRRPLQDCGRQHRRRGERELHETPSALRRCRRSGRTCRSRRRSERSTTCV